MNAIMIRVGQGWPDGNVDDDKWVSHIDIVYERTGVGVHLLSE